MSGVPADLAAWFAAHHGVIDRRHLDKLGLTRGQVGTLLDRGEIVSVQRGSYRSAAWPVTELGRCVAACLAVRIGAISYETAARLWGLRGCTGTIIHVSAPAATRTRMHDIQLHRVCDLERNDIVRRGDGIALTSPIRTACDLAAHLDEERLVGVIEQVLDVYRVRFVTLARTAARLTRPGRPGSARLRAVIEGRSPEAAAKDSHQEVRFARALRHAGLPEPVPQLPVEIASGLFLHPDLGFPATGLVVELDHRAWHSGAQAAVDKRRDRQVRLAGYETVRITDDDLRNRFDETVDEVVRIHALVGRRQVG